MVYGVVLAGIGAIVAASRRRGGTEPTDALRPDERLLRTGGRHAAVPDAAQRDAAEPIDEAPSGTAAPTGRHRAAEDQGERHL